jgi:hypothetical protein
VLASSRVLGDKTGAGSIPPCLRAVGQRVTLHVGLIQITRLFGDAPPAVPSARERPPAHERALSAADPGERSGLHRGIPGHGDASQRRRSLGTTMFPGGCAFLLHWNEPKAAPKIDLVMDKFVVRTR